MVIDDFKGALSLLNNLLIGIKVVIDSKAIMSVLGTEMDFIETDLQSQFTFNNPNVKESCGCGQSFSV